MRLIAGQIGMRIETVMDYSHVIESVSIKDRSEARSSTQDGCVTAKWLVSVLLAIAVGDTECMARVLASLENTFLEKIVTQRETYANWHREDSRILVNMEVLTEHFPEPVSWNLNGTSFLHALVGLVEQLSSAPDGSHHKHLGKSYTIDLSWSDGAPYISIESELARPNEKDLLLSVVYEGEAAPDAFTLENSVKPRRTLPVVRTSTLTSSHLKMIAGILAAARDDQFSGSYQ